MSENVIASICDQLRNILYKVDQKISCCFILCNILTQNLHSSTLRKVIITSSQLFLRFPIPRTWWQKEVRQLSGLDSGGLREAAGLRHGSILHERIFEDVDGRSFTPHNVFRRRN